MAKYPLIFQKSRTRILLQQLLLMLLRTLAVAAVILMFAGPKAVRLLGAHVSDRTCPVLNVFIPTADKTAR